MQCRICLDESNPELMISPCKCRGSVKWVHSNCLHYWFKNNSRNCQKCNSCNFKYQYQEESFFKKFIIDVINLLMDNIHAYSCYVILFYIFFIIGVFLFNNIYYDFSLSFITEIGNLIIYFHLGIELLAIFLIDNLDYFFQLNYFGMFCCLIAQSCFFYIFYTNPTSFIILHGFIASWYQTLLLHLNSLNSLKKENKIKSFDDEEIKYL